MGKNGELTPEERKKRQEEALKNLAKAARKNLPRLAKNLKFNLKMMTGPKIFKIHKALRKIHDFDEALNHCRHLGCEEERIGKAIFDEIGAWAEKQEGE